MCGARYTISFIWRPLGINQSLTSVVPIGGWDATSGDISKDIEAEIEQAFANVNLNIKDAGGKGWEQVFRMTTYHVVLNDERHRRNTSKLQEVVS